LGQSFFNPFLGHKSRGSKQTPILDQRFVRRWLSSLQQLFSCVVHYALSLVKTNGYTAQSGEGVVVKLVGVQVRLVVRFVRPACINPSRLALQYLSPQKSFTSSDRLHHPPHNTCTQDAQVGMIQTRKYSTHRTHTPDAGPLTKLTPLTSFCHFCLSATTSWRTLFLYFFMCCPFTYSVAMCESRTCPKHSRLFTESYMST
jgi:hypothetical protein